MPNFRRLWKLRYRFYAVLTILVLFPMTVYTSSNQTPLNIEPIGYRVLRNNFLAQEIQIDNSKVRETPKPEDKIPVVPENPTPASDKTPITPPKGGTTTVSNNTDVTTFDREGNIITKKLRDAGYEISSISSSSLKTSDIVSSVTPEDIKQASEEPQIPAKKKLDEIMPKPKQAVRTNFLSYPKYKINTPIQYSTLEDHFEKNKDGSLNFNKARDTGDVNSPLQQKLRFGIVHLAFSPSVGEFGNSYIIGHSSNYSFVKSDYNQVFKPIESRSKVGDEFIIWDTSGRELKFRVFDARKITEDDTAEAYKDYPDRRVVTLQTSILGVNKQGQIAATHRWLTRGELVQ